MSSLFLQGNAKSVLKNLPVDWFHCAMTSPPYFGLRKYQGGEEIWGGRENCQHEWGAEIVRRDRGTAKGENAVVGNQLREVSGVDTKQGNFCSKCGAWKGQLGGEPTTELYIQHLVEICRGVRRVLRPDGVFWLNVGDSWAGSWGNNGARSGTQRPNDNASWNRKGYTEYTERPATSFKLEGIKPLDMVLIPEQLALVLRADGWYLRSILIWAKGVSLSDEYNGNPMPESVNGWRWERHKVKVSKSARANPDGYHSQAYGDSPMGARDGREFADHSKEWHDCPGCPKCEKRNGYVLRKGSWRPTDSYEQILMLTKTANYYCDREAVLERGVYPAGEFRSGGNGHKSLDAGSRTTEGLHNKDWNGNGGRNLRSVLMIPTTGYKGAHFAVFPPRLVEPLIKAATSEKGCCLKCGSPWARVIQKPGVPHDGETDCKNLDAQGNTRRLAVLRQAARERGQEYANQSSTIGWLPTCSCNIQETEPCRVLDPFSGAGTTPLVCEHLGLDSIGIDTSAEYIKLAETRIIEDEQKRIDEQIRQIKKVARLSSKSG